MEVIIIVLAVIVLHALPPSILFPSSPLLSPLGPKLGCVPDSSEGGYSSDLKAYCGVRKNQFVWCHLSQVTGKWTLKSLCLIFTEFTNVLSALLK